VKSTKKDSNSVPAVKKIYNNLRRNAAKTARKPPLYLPPLDFNPIKSYNKMHGEVSLRQLFIFILFKKTDLFLKSLNNQGSKNLGEKEH
jgi:hypothetical protein